MRMVTDSSYAAASRTDRSAALARFLRLLESARPADIRAVVSALPEADLAAAVEAAQGRISLAIREYILDEGPSRALIALARQAILGRGEAAADIVDRVLMRCDPMADAAFFEAPASASSSQARRARRVILRDRKGPDGHAIIAPAVKQSLLNAFAATATATDTASASDGGPDRALLSELAYADDPDLVLAVAPYGDKLSAAEAAAVIITLDAYGLRAQAKRHRGLWAGRGRTFRVLGFRRFGALSEKYAFTADFSRVPNLHVANPVTLDQYRELVEASQSPQHAGFAHIRAVAWTSLRAGTMTPAEVLEHTRPAAAAISLAVCEDSADERPGERRAADDMRVLITETALEHLGEDAKAWGRAVTWVNFSDGTLLQLLADPTATRDRRPSQNYSTHISGDLDAANVLLALAPRDTAARALTTKRMKHTINAAAAGAPLCRALVEHIVTRGTIPQREALAANEAAPDSVLARLLEQRELTHIGLAIIERFEVGPEIFARACATAPRGSLLREWTVDSARFYPIDALTALRSMTDDPSWLLSLLRATANEFDEPYRIAAYALLAEVAGMEPVWALELDRSGSLEKMAPYVRESMATGDAEPLYAATRANPVVQDEEPDAEPDWPRTDEALDHPLNQPLENLVRNRLDGRVERWQQLAGLLAARPDATDEELIGEFHMAARRADC